MHRRTFLISAAALTVTPALVHAASGTPYTPGLVDEKLAAGETVLVDFYTRWCSTCAVQQRVISALKDENPAYDEAISFVSVDWDQHSQSKLANRLAIPRRSTLVLLKGDEELGRIVAGTRPGDIQALMDTALDAATA